MATKYYAVKTGRQTGIYTDWNTCKAQVDGFPGAEYKSFKTKPEAEEYLGTPIETTVTNTKEPNVPKNEIVAYVDGSWHPDTPNLFGAGIVTFYHNLPMQTSCILYEDTEMAKMRNVAGELAAAAGILQECKVRKERGYTLQKLTICHDYEGIAKWCTGQWQTKNKYTKAYKALYDEVAALGFEICFVKIAGHTGNPFNEKADELANLAFTNDWIVNTPIFETK